AGLVSRSSRADTASSPHRGARRHLDEDLTARSRRFRPRPSAGSPVYPPSRVHRAPVKHLYATCLASREEKHRAMPADSVVPAPMWTATHALTMNAAPQHVWPWLAQMGAGRAGWYNYDRIDNGGHPSANCIRQEDQHVVPGDLMPAVPGATDAFRVVTIEPPHDLVLVVPDASGGHQVSWEFLLEPL